MCKSAFYHLRKISLIRKQLTFDTAQILVHALITSKLDYCNSLLYGLPKHVIKQLQRVQNAAARIVSLSPKFCQLFLWVFTEYLSVITHKTLHGLAPAYIEDLLCNNITGRYLRSAKKNVFALPGLKLNSYGRRVFTTC